MKILGIIPARSGSKRIHHKNLRELCGVPMIEFTIGAAKNSILDDVVITTDYPKEIFKDIEVIERPEYLATDDAKTIDTIKHVMEIKNDYDAYMILQPTSPLRIAKDIDDAINYYKENNAKSLYTGNLIYVKTKDKIFNRSEIAPHFQRNGAIFITTKELVNQGKLWDDDVLEYIMPMSRSIDVDTMDDIKIAEALLMYDMVED